MIANIILDTILLHIEAVKTVILMHVIFGFRFITNIKFRLLILSALSVFSFTILHLKKASEMRLALLVPSMIILVMFIFKEKRRRIILFYMISFLFIAIVDIIACFLVINLPSIYPNTLYGDKVAGLFTDLISLAAYIPIALTLRKSGKSPAHLLKNLHWSNYLLIIWLFISFAFQLGYLQNFSHEYNQKYPIRLFILIVLVTTGIIAIIALMCRASYSRDRYKALANMNQEYLKMQQQYYLSLSDRNEDIRRFRHDINNHFVCLSAIAKERRYDNLIEYLDTIIRTPRKLHIG